MSETKNKTLTVILCQTRETSLTYDSLRKNVLSPLKSDLAFCGSLDVDSNKDDHSFLQHCRFIWAQDEPLDWIDACDDLSIDGGAWRALAAIHPNFLGGTGYLDSVGSGIIIMFWREILRAKLTEEIISSYEWFVITRSDFFWKVKHPKVKNLNENFIYLLDGEKYGGISDRHIIFHRNFAEKVLSMATPIFQDAKTIEAELRELSHGYLNPEIYLDFIAKRFEFKENIRFLPYLGYTIRGANTKTRWSTGTYDARLDLYIKYPEEYQAALQNTRKFKWQIQWARFLKKL